MPEHGLLAGADSKSSKKWRGKLFSRDKDRPSTETQVDDFLASSRQSSQPVPSPAQQQFQQQPPAIPNPDALPAPRLDVSFHHSSDPNDRSPSSPTLPQIDLPKTSPRPPAPVVPKAAPVSPAPAPAPAPAAPPPAAIGVAVAGSPPKKRPRKVNLRVAFSNANPEIIGEGGDEEETPTIEMISVYRTRSNSSASARSGSSLSPHGFSPVGREPAGSPTNAPPPPSLQIQRSNSSESGSEQWKPPLVHNSQDSDFLLSVGANTRGSRLSLRSDAGNPNSFARRVQAQMRAEEGKALQNRIQEPEQPSTTYHPADPDDEPEAPPPPEHHPQQRQNQTASPPSGGEKSSGMGFWSDVMAALPGKKNGSRQEVDRPTIVPSPAKSPETHVESPPPLYGDAHQPYPPRHLGTSSRESSYRDHERQDSSTSKKSLRGLANAVTDTASAEFSSFTAQYEQQFGMAAESVKPSMETSLSEWIRACAWWFLQGRGELESVMRSRPTSIYGGAQQSPSTDQLQQAAVNLAKAWWINQHIVPRHPGLHRFGNVNTETMATLARTAGDSQTASLLELHQTIIGNLRALAMSMKRNNILPLAADAQTALSRGVDTNIWLKYPFFSPDVSAVLSGMVSRSMLVENTAKMPDIADLMPMKDTERQFCYGRMFVDAYISSGEDDSQQYAIPCMLSINRARSDWNVIATITSQSELVNIVIQSDKKQGSTWSDVKWHVKNYTLTLRLPRGFELDINFGESDFKMLWKIVEYTRSVETTLEPEVGEKPIFEDVLSVFQYFDKSGSGSFPPEPTQRCRIRLFERTVRITEGTGSRECHRGFRLAAVTSPKVKSVSTICHTLGNGSPILFSYLRGDDGAPALLLKLEEKGVTYSMLMTFQDPELRAQMHALLMGVTPTLDETTLVKDLPLRSFSMEPLGQQNSEGSTGKSPIQFSSSAATVINSIPDHGECGPTVLSESLRAFVTTNWGSVSDRINLGPGELKMSLEVDMPSAISFVRPAQLDMGISIAENLVPADLAGSVTNFLRTVSSKPVVRRYHFMEREDLHQFQFAVTGFKVLFDGMASMFAISRRRMVVPIYKKWESSKARIQIIQQEKVIQLLAFFGDFSHGKSMNFAVKSTDIMESFSRSGKYGIKIVDAKFALPKAPENEDAEFICLDMPEYPGEHDDITIGFDAEAESLRFQQALPGSVREQSRIGSLRK